MRTPNEKHKRKLFTRVISIFCLVIGVLRSVWLLVHIATLPESFLGLLGAFEPVYLWFLVGGAFMGLSRIWGELGGD